MWILRNINSEECYYLLPEKEIYKVGRAGTDLDIVLRDDTSISRTHAVLHLCKTENSSLKLEDMGSKFGTYHNELQMGKDNKIDLHEGDRIRFGLLENVWNVSYWPLVSMASALPEKQVPLFEQYLAALGGKVIQRWDASCTHLTMDEVTVTVKALHALLEQIPIVTCNYWRDLFNAVRQRGAPLPSPEKYIPRCCETIIRGDSVNLGSLPERKSVFVGMTFVFMNRKHYDMYAPIVEKAGAHCRDLNSSGGVQKSFLVNNKVVVIQYVPSTQSESTQTINSVEDYLELHSRRIIPEYEIGLAVLHCSAAKYCNPSYNILNDIMPSSVPSTASAPSENIFAQNTHVSTCGPGSESFDVLIPETEVNSRICPKVLHAVMDVHDGQESTNVERESLPKICITERFVEQPQVKRKCQVIADDDGNEDETLFQFSKMPHKKLKTTDETRSVGGTGCSAKLIAKPLPSDTIAKNKGTRTIDISGFLEKPQSSKTQENCTSMNNKPAGDELAQRKRPHIAIITDEDDDDDDDLFNFGDASAFSGGIKKSRINEENNGNDSGEELFDFSKHSKDSVGKDGDHNDGDLAPTEQFVLKGKKKCVQNQLPKPKLLPKKVSTEGWLSCSLEKVKLDPETVKTENSPSHPMEKKEEDGESLTHEKWVDTLKAGCQVHICTFDLKISAKETLRHQSDPSGNDESVDISIGKRTNFKKFIKQYHRPCHSENRSTC